jgi:pseudouridine-5'-phosphate glycosidase
VRTAPEVAEALAGGRPVVALESAIVTHGLPRPRNLEVARQVEEAVREGGAVPATVAVVAGEARIGVDGEELASLAEREDVVKCGLRDLAPAAARGAYGGTTVAATAQLAARAGIRVFATGGIGGVHRDARDSWDESADLDVLARTRIVVVCAGVKSILDVGATLERLETLSVSVLGYGTDRFPGFYLTESDFPAPWRVDSAAEAAAVVRAAAEVGADERAVVVANPVPVDEQVDPALHDRVLTEGLIAAEAAGVRGRDVTPFLLDHLARRTNGASLEANVRLVVRNARLAAEIASELAV